jgi:hypothetical protein
MQKSGTIATLVAERSTDLHDFFAANKVAAAVFKA